MKRRDFITLLGSAAMEWDIVVVREGSDGSHRQPAPGAGYAGRPPDLAKHFGDLGGDDRAPSTAGAEKRSTGWRRFSAMISGS
jgi:hypothetical protein